MRRHFPPVSRSVFAILGNHTRNIGSYRLPLCVDIIHFHIFTRNHCCCRLSKQTNKQTDRQRNKQTNKQTNKSVRAFTRIVVHKAASIMYLCTYYGNCQLLSNGSISTGPTHARTRASTQTNKHIY